MKKLLSIMFAIVLLIPTTSAFAQAGNVPSEWFNEDINRGIELGIIPARLQSSYASPITREECAELLVNVILDKLKTVDGDIMWTKETILEKVTIDSPFEDTDLDHVNLAYIIGSLSDVSETKFDPDSYITRQQAAMMLMNTIHASNTFSYLSEEELGYSDLDEIAEWAVPAVNALKYLGIMNGSGDKFVPGSNITREQAMATVMRIHDNISYFGLMLRGNILANPMIPELKYHVGKDYVNVSYVDDNGFESTVAMETWALFGGTRESGVPFEANKATVLLGFEYNIANIEHGLITDTALQGIGAKVDYGYMEVETFTEDYLLEFQLKPVIGYMNKFFDYTYGYPQKDVEPKLIID
ncbi:S-layer homology domain-containing protein [Cytobacillus sp. IB215665]|uniref:S-layer homology domain-containing protein n=1 Tax=Cytobacillus sp. IB215665 TaxID=3097357 RepID=UPI002A0C2B69|nr:S-layer homology domain-containing protein [Cytobacillus sp. IB215665]MDX8367207.1 S-layer homology domain-containing protein [Cytobacillus sp. IB215665]